MAFYVKELLLTGTRTRRCWSSLIDQIEIVSLGMEVNRAKAPNEQGVFAGGG